MQSIGNHFADKAIDHVKSRAKFQGTGDNWDQRIRVHEMRKDHQNIDCHYFASNLVVERVPCHHLDNISPKGDIRQAANIDFLLNQEEMHHLREEYKIIVGRVLVEFIPELRFLKTVIPNHISHQYSNEMANKSTIIPLPILFKDEKKYDDVVDILDSYEAWLEEIYTKAGVVQIPQPQISHAPAVAPSRPAVAPPRPAVVPPGPVVAPPRPAVVPPRPAVVPPGPAVVPPRPAVVPPGPAVVPPRPAVVPPGPAVAPPRPAVAPPRPAVAPPRPVVVPPGPAVVVPRPAVAPPGTVDAHPGPAVAPLRPVVVSPRPVMLPPRPVVVPPGPTVVVPRLAVAPPGPAVAHPRPVVVPPRPAVVVPRLAVAPPGPAVAHPRPLVVHPRPAVVVPRPVVAPPVPAVAPYNISGLQSLPDQPGVSKKIQAI